MVFGTSSLAVSLPGAGDKKAREQELSQLKEENNRLKQEIDNLSAKLDLLITRMGMLEKTVAEIKNPNLEAKRQEQIREESIVSKEPPPVEKNKDTTPNLRVVKIEPEPQKPGPPRTQKVISFGDDKNNPNNPKITIRNEASAPPAKPPDKNKVTELKVPGNSPAAAETLSDDEIKKLADEKKYGQAEAALNDRLKEKPPEKEACGLYMSLAEIRGRAGNAVGSAKAYLELADRHPTCDQAPEALFNAGELYQKSDQNKSRKLFQDLISLYPYSNYANLAEEKLKK